MSGLRFSSFSLLDFYPECQGAPEDRFDAVAQQARHAERLGFEAFWIAEHHRPKPSLSPNPAVALAALARRTERILLGPAVAILPLRSARAVAEDYAMVHAASGGRLVFGVGTGSQPDEYAALGVPFDERRAAFAATLGEIESLWRDRGAHSSNEERLAATLPAGLAPPEIYVASMSEAGAREAGASGYGLLTMISPVTTDLAEITGRLEAHRTALADGGGSPGTKGPGPLVPAGKAGRESTPGARDPVVAVFALIASTEAELRTRADPAARRLARHWFGIPDEAQDGLLDLVLGLQACLFCTAAEAPARLARYRSLGVRRLALVSDFGGLPADVSLATMTRAAAALAA